jgi:hypothetical protein
MINLDDINDAEDTINELSIAYLLRIWTYPSLKPILQKNKYTIPPIPSKIFPPMQIQCIDMYLLCSIILKT